MRFAGVPFSFQAFPVHLFTGDSYIVPPGQYLWTAGRVSVLEYFDDLDYIWRPLGFPGARGFPFVSDGLNFRIRNNSGTVTGVAITNAGSGYANGIGATATGLAVTFGSAPTNGRAATAYPVVGGSINTTVTVTAAGTGYLVPPRVVFDPAPQGGVTATGYAVLSGTTIGSIVVTNPGAGYTSAPNAYVIPQWASYPGGYLIYPRGSSNASDIQITPPTMYGATTTSIPNNLTNQEGALVGAGSGAVLTVNATLTNSGAVTAVVMRDYGANYLGTAIPTVTFTGGGSSAAGTAIMSFSVTSVTVSNAGAAISTAPSWDTSMGLVQAHDGDNNYYSYRPATGISTLSSTTTTIITSLTVEDPGYGMQKVPVVGFKPAGGTAWTTNPAGTAVCGGIADTSYLQPGVS
ncbi:MAG: hypothetical protein KGL39_12430 [Patescibacteria group bacterium]|nr:hypothetical protein [Patescibacteria group bacterium]